MCGAALPEASLRSRDRLYGVPGEFDVSVCSRCRAGVTLPVIEDDQLSSLYPESYAAHATPAGLAISVLLRAHHAWRDQVTLRTPPLSLLKRRKPGRLLDVGCGKGELGELLLRHGWEVVGIDPSPDACRLARAHGIDARVGNLGTVALDLDTFDAVLFSHSLEHVSDPVGDLRLAARTLRPDGMLVVSVPNFGCWQRRTFGSRWVALDLPRHRVHFTREALERALDEAGLSVGDVSTQTSFSILPLTLQCAAVGRPFFRGPASRRLMMALYVVLYPASALANAAGGGGDVLTVAALPESQAHLAARAP